MGRSPCCLKVGLHKGSWSATEDILLTKYIECHGLGDWRNLPQRAGLRRCGKSCRLRWLNYLRPTIKRGNISPDEEDLIIRLHRLLGNRWSLIAGRLPGRTDNEIKNFWNSHLSKKLRMAGIDPLTHKPLQPHYNNTNPAGQHIQAANIQQDNNPEITDGPSTITDNDREVLPSSTCNTEIVTTMQVAHVHLPLPNRFISFPPSTYSVSYDKNNCATMGDMLENSMAVNHNLEECPPDSNTCDGVKQSSISTVGDDYEHNIVSWMQQCYNDDNDDGDFNSVELQNVFQEYWGLLKFDHTHYLESN